MSDILDVLNIKSFPSKKSKEILQQQNQKHQNSSEFKQVHTSEENTSNAKRRKISSMNRELYNLIGPNVPPLAIDTASVANAGSLKKFKEKLVNTKANSPWRHLGFKNSARDDDLVLFHWTKAVPLNKINSDSIKIGEDIPKKENQDISNSDKISETIKNTVEKESKGDEKMEVDEEIKAENTEIEMDPNEYRYVKYNTKLNIPTFTEEEFVEAMKSEKEKRKNELEAKEAKEKIKLEKEKMLAKKAENKNTPIEAVTAKVTESGKTETKVSQAKEGKKSQVETLKEKEVNKNEDIKQQDLAKESDTNKRDETAKTADNTKQEGNKEKTEIASESDEKIDTNVKTDKVDDKTVTNEKAKAEGNIEHNADDKTEEIANDNVEDNAENKKDKPDDKTNDEKEGKQDVKSENKSGDKSEDKSADNIEGEKITTKEEKDSSNKIVSDDSTDQSTVTTEEHEEDKKIEERPWTYEETKFLFDLCNNYDMRWAVIFDRYQDKYDDRIVEDLKIHMYSISAHLLEKRGNLNDLALIKALRTFNREKELERKFYLNKLIHRAPTEIAEEESLVIEARKFELAAKKMLLERAQLLQLLDSPQSSASVQQYLTSQGLTQLYNSLMSADKSKKRKAEVPVAPLLGPNAIPHTQHLHMSSSSSSNNNTNLNNNSNNSNNNNNNSNNNGNNGSKKRSNGSSSNNNSNNNTKSHSNTTNTTTNNNNNSTNNLTTKTPSKLSEVQQLLQKNLTPEELEIYGIEIHNERIQPGVHVRSQKIASFKPSVQAKVHEILGQLGLSIKPTMPTGPVSQKFDELLYKISHLVDLKKQSDKLITEIELIKRQKGVN